MKSFDLGAKRFELAHLVLESSLGIGGVPARGVGVEAVLVGLERCFTADLIGLATGLRSDALGRLLCCKQDGFRIVAGNFG